MELTTHNAHLYVGKRLYGGTGHSYPLEVSRRNGAIVVFDRLGVPLRVPNDSTTPVNRIYFTEARA